MEKPDPDIKWITKKGESKCLGIMDYHHLKNCKNMLVRGKKMYLPIYQHLVREITYRDWVMSNKEDDNPMSRFDLIDFD